MLLNLVIRQFRRVREFLARELDACRMEQVGLLIHPLAKIQAKTHQVIVSGRSTVGAFTIIVVKNQIGGHVTDSQFVIGNGTSIGEHCNLRATGGNIEIGDQVMIASHVTMAASNHGIARDMAMMDQPWQVTTRDIIIGNDVWIAAGATILPGARIGNGCVIAAGAVVRGVIAEYSIVGGIPARVIGFRTP
jgi:acetyltransferase-like isoleucine patch superfamily enzyme